MGAAHYHRDEATFELYGYGTELVVDTGKHNHDYEDPRTIYQYSVEGHNIVVVDESTYERQPGRPRIHGHGDGWVQAIPDNYTARGVDQVRSFAYARPETFVVIDHMTASERHRYDQHVHIAPVLNDVGSWTRGP